MQPQAPPDKLLQAAAPRILEEALKAALEEAAPRPSDVLSKLIPKGEALGQVTQLLGAVDAPSKQLASALARAVAGVPPERALKALQRMLEVLREYGLCR